MIGQIKFFNTTKGFGFITLEDGGKDVFVHVTAVPAAGLRRPNEGQRVSFEVDADKRGPKAVNLNTVSEERLDMRERRGSDPARSAF